MNFLKLGLIAMSGAYLYATGAMANANVPNAAQLTQASLVEDIGASERVEAAAILRVLSQKVASTACHMAGGVELEQSRDLLVASKTQFTAILDALQYGNPSMNIIGGEERGRTIVKIENLRTQWLPVKAAALRLLDDANNADALAIVKAESEVILASAFELTSELAGQYSNPAELMQSDVMLLDFAGRQALLTQKIAKVSCEIWSGNRAEDRLSLLSSSMQTYDLTLIALHEGMPAVGIIAAPTDEIGGALQSARDDWSIIKGKLDTLMSDTNLTETKRADLFTNLNIAMYDMERLEKLYVAYSKHDYN